MKTLSEVLNEECCRARGINGSERLMLFSVMGDAYYQRAPDTHLATLRFMAKCDWVLAGYRFAQRGQK